MDSRASSPNLLLRLGMAVALFCAVLITGAIPHPVPDRAAGAPTPVVDALDSTAGSLAGGESVTFTGINLSGVTRVTFDGRAAMAVTARSNSAITVTVPNSLDYKPGPVDVDVYATTDFDRVETLPYTYEVRTAVDRQMQYAFAHWRDYNLAQYGSFNDRGGDCMNFVSQTLVARGWTPTSEWFNTAGTDWASPFIYVPDFDTWMTAHPEFGAVRMSMDDLDKVRIGDVVMIDWENNGFFNHAQVVSAVAHVNGETRVYMAGHNLDGVYRDLVSTLKAESKDATAYFWSLPAG
ncbi:MAG: hypothetical protein JWP85_1916 [Rhodoglobus sp.]|nr:hypothetical protein [Rhodoglobus sp.]